MSLYFFMNSLIVHGTCAVVFIRIPRTSLSWLRWLGLGRGNYYLGYPGSDILKVSPVTGPHIVMRFMGLQSKGCTHDRLLNRTLRVLYTFEVVKTWSLHIL